MRYVSLVDRLPAEERAFSDVWRIVGTSEGLYFRTSERLFRWDGSEMKVWHAETRVRHIFTVGDTLYVPQADVGLMRMDDDSLVMAPGGDLFKDHRIYAAVPGGEATYLAITREVGMFRCVVQQGRGEACAPFGTTGLTELLATARAYHAAVLGGGDLAIATLGGGVLLVDGAGRLRRVLNAALGLRDEDAKYAYVDRQGGLWLGLNNGLARVETGAPVSYFDKTMGLLGSVNDVARHRGRLHAATGQGVFALEPAAEGAAPRSVPLPEMAWACWSLLSTPQGLLAGCSSGVFDVDRRKRILPVKRSVFEVVRSRRDPTLLYLGLATGLARMRLSVGKWTDDGPVDGFREQVWSIVEDDQGILWLGTRISGVLRFDPATADLSRFGTANGLPPGWIDVRPMAGRVVFVNRAGLFRLADPAGEEGRFVPDTSFDAFLLSPSKRHFRLDEDALRRVWVAVGEASSVAHLQPDGSYGWEPTALRRTGMRDAYAAYVETGSAFWVAGPHGLIRLDTDSRLDPSPRFPVAIRRITSAGALLYDGRRRNGTGRRPGGQATEWPYRDNALRFTFAAPRYSAPERTRLEGFDDEWSAWSHDYTNLWEGRYAFRVQASNVYGLLSQEARFAFRILPPWYRTWWAYALYVLALAGVVLAWVRSHRLEFARERQTAERER